MDQIKQTQLHRLLALIRNAIWNDPLPDNVKFCQTDSLQPLLELAEKHGLLHLAAYALDKAGMSYPAETSKGTKLVSAQLAAVTSFGMQTHVLSQLSTILEQAQIPFLPLKGSVLRHWYPQPWMRSSCDIDVLIHPEDLERADALLTAKGFVFYTKCDHDRSYMKDRVHLELHFTTMEEGQAAQSDRVLENIWDFAHPIEGKGYWQELNPEMFWFYHLAHLSKHFLIGGCGIRPLLDIKILQQKMPCRPELLQHLLQEGGLDRFADIIFKLTEVWFGTAEMTGELAAFEEYILNGGVYGSMSNYIILHAADTPGRGSYVWRRLFMPLREMKIKYPILDKYPGLMPFLWVHRLFVILFHKNRRNRLRHEIRVLETLDESKHTSHAVLLQQSGLKLKE